MGDPQGERLRRSGNVRRAAQMCGKYANYIGGWERKGGRKRSGRSDAEPSGSFCAENGDIFTGVLDPLVFAPFKCCECDIMGDDESVVRLPPVLLRFPAHWDPKLRIPRGQVVAAASIVSPKY